MSVYDLATDVGLVNGTDEYDTFVAIVENILELGSAYPREAMQDIVEKCKQSELDIAKRVIRECRREKTSRFREPRLKWWETYIPRRERISRDIYIDRKPSKQDTRRRTSKKRPMSPMFERRKPEKRSAFERHEREERSASPMYERRKPQKRPMSPMFERRKLQKRPMSPMFERRKQKSVPQWGKRAASPPRRSPSPKYGRYKKRRRY
jgi:hypothetical protein